jgi:hypothetical protein
MLFLDEIEAIEITDIRKRRAEGLLLAQHLWRRCTAAHELPSKGLSKVAEVRCLRYAC